MGDCNLECCRCIEKKETQFNQISSQPSFNNNLYINRCNQIKCLGYSDLIIQKNNKDSRSEKKSSIQTIEEEKNFGKKKYDDKTKPDSNYKEISLKYSRNNTRNRFYSPNNRYQNNLDNLYGEIRKKTINNTKNNNCEYFENYGDNEEDIVIVERKSPPIRTRYFHTNFRKLKNNTYNKYFDKIEDNKKELDMTEFYKKYQNINNNTFQVKYNYHKDKYITYFTDDNMK